MSQKLYPRTALALLTGLNLMNYLDRSVLFAVQPLIQKELGRSDAQFGLLTTAFFFCYMVAAPFMGVLGDRYSRKLIMFAGAALWSAATLLTAVTYSYDALLVRHTLVGIGEATFVTIAPSFLADLFPEQKRGSVLAIFYINIGLGTALGYMLGGYMGERWGWRSPFLVAGIPGFLLALALMSLPEPPRGQQDTLEETPERGTLAGLARNPAYWTATLGMAMVTFALGGLQVWMPTFLSRMRHVPLDRANLIFGGLTAFNAIVATLLGGWLGDRMLRRSPGAYYLVSAVTLALGIPAMAVAILNGGRGMFPAIFAAEFLLFLNTGPLNAAVVNSVGAHIRATAIAVNLFTIHLLGDAFSPTLIGYSADRSNLQTGFLAAIVAVALAAAVLFYGTRFAPRIRMSEAQAAGTVRP